MINRFNTKLAALAAGITATLTVGAFAGHNDYRDLDADSARLERLAERLACDYNDDLRKAGHACSDERRLLEAMRSFASRARHLHKAIHHGYTTAEARARYARGAADEVKGRLSHFRVHDHICKLFDEAHRLAHEIEDAVQAANKCLLDRPRDNERDRYDRNGRNDRNRDVVRSADKRVAIRRGGFNLSFRLP